MAARPIDGAPLLALSAFSVYANGLDHPEGLAFDADGVLWCGGEAGQIYRIPQPGRPEQVASLGGFNLGLTFSPDGELWVCNSGLGALLRIDRNGRVLQTIEGACGRRLQTPNFSVFDSSGNLYFTDSGEWKRDDGYVYVLRRSGAIEAMAGPLSFPNGLALSRDERWLYVAQSGANNVLRLATGRSGPAAEVEVFAAIGRVPDGLAFDANGALYVTCYASDNLFVVSPERQVSLLAFDPEGTMIARPTNIAFGGEAFDEIYVANLGRWHICRAAIGTPGQPLANQRCSSRSGA